MKLGGRLAAAIDVLADIETRHRPANEALKDWGTSHRFAGSGDRGVIGNIVYDALRWRSSSAWIMGDEAPRAVVLGAMARHWAVGPDGLAAAIAGDPHSPPAVSAGELERLKGAALADAPPHVRADVPEWAGARLERVFGEAWVAEGAAFATRPSVDMRANTIKAGRDKILKSLIKFGAVATTLAPVGIRIPPTRDEQRHPNVEAEGAFQRGWFEVQDEGSQVAALLTGARPGIQVLDLCAGAGGKTLALAAAMGGKGRVIATDSDRARLAPIFERVKRAAAHNVEIRAAGAALDDLAARMDVVLVDAPCTGTGTWRRRPDAKWRVTERALANRVGEQVAILDQAARFVKPGGRLVYVTCSVLPDENEDRVSAFLGAHAEFGIVPPVEVVAAADVGAGLAAAALLRPTGVMLTPRRTNTDGFFVAVLRRQ
jgi:16S rRNA (cytosine967-C5)-methyltransferase